MKWFRSNFKIILAIVWLNFVLSMVTWWWINGVTELRKYSNVDADAIRKIHMLTWEGAFFLIAIFVGGVAILILLYRDKLRIEQMRLFFSNFNHDLKTSIARVRLQTDLIAEEIKGSEHLVRLTEDINRLNLQLENSLLLSTHFGSQLLVEDFKLSQIISELRSECEEVEIKLKADVRLRGDRRVLSSLFRNLIHNSILHGKAKAIMLAPHTVSHGRVRIDFLDDGIGFLGSEEQLKTLGRSLQSSSGRRGFGLFVSQNLLRKMGGNMTFSKPKNGFCAQITVPGAIL